VSFVGTSCWAKSVRQRGGLGFQSCCPDLDTAGKVGKHLSRRRPSAEKISKREQDRSQGREPEQVADGEAKSHGGFGDLLNYKCVNQISPVIDRPKT
jgi:hypothetical protein